MKPRSRKRSREEGGYDRLGQRIACNGPKPQGGEQGAGGEIASELETAPIGRGEGVAKGHAGERPRRRAPLAAAAQRGRGWKRKGAALGGRAD